METGYAQERHQKQEKRNELSAVPRISLADFLPDHAAESVRRLKIHCERGESLLLESATADVVGRIPNIVFEHHRIDGAWVELESVKQRLRREGCVLHTRRGLVSV